MYLYSRVQQREANAKAEAWNDVGLLIGEVQQQSAALAYSAAYPYLPQVEKGYHFGRLAAASEVPYPHNTVILKRIFNLNHDFLEAMAANEASTEAEREEAKNRHACLQELKPFKEDVERVSSVIRDDSSAAELREVQRQLGPIHAKWENAFTRANEKYPFITKEDLQKESKTPI
ncbi:MAG: hypothetical protein WD972_02765 [Candidatus Andersenbacteria bacterium]